MERGGGGPFPTFSFRRRRRLIPLANVIVLLFHFFLFFSVAHFCVIETLVSFAICGRSWPARRSESGRPFPRVAKGWPDRSDREPISGRGIVARLVIQVDPRSERRPSAGRQNGRPEPPGRPMRPRRPQRRRFGCGFEIVARYLAATDRDDDRLVIG